MSAGLTDYHIISVMHTNAHDITYTICTQAFVPATEDQDTLI